MPRIESIVVHDGPQGPKGNDSVAPGSVATSDGQMIANVGGTITAIAAPTAGQQLRKSKAGPIAWLRGPHVNLADVLTAGSSDHTAELRAVIEGNGPGYTYHLPAGMTVNLPLGNVPASAVRLRNQVYIEGEGPRSIINVTGSNANPGSAYYAIGVDWNAQAEDITGAGISNLTIQGDGPGASQTSTGWQASAVRILTSAQLQNNLIFQDVIFLNHNGFPLHCDGAYQNSLHAMIERCQFINCGNGLNYNAGFATVRHCYFTNTEGIENSGPGNVIDGNVFVNIFSAAASIGGDQSTGAAKKALPGTRVVNNQIFGVLGGTGYGSGVGIITAQSSPDQLIANNYIERSYGAGIQTTHDGTGTLGPDDGVTILGNHLVNCGNPGTSGGTAAISLGGPNVSVLANRAYNRVSNTGDPYPLGSYRSLYGISLGAISNVLIDGNFIDMSNGGQYCIAISGSPTGITIGRNRFIPGSSYANFQYTSAATFLDAEGVLGGTVSGGTITGANLLGTYRTLRQVSPGANKTGTLLTAVGRAGLQQTFVNTDATFTLALTPNGTEQINGVNATKTLGVNSAVTLTSDGSNWLAQIHYGTFA